MIVVDENIHSREIMASIAAWYRGQVISITGLRPRSVIHDDAIPGLLQTLDRPTFVTTNVDDFWMIVPAHSGYCFVCFHIPKERNRETPVLLRRLLTRPEFRTKALRMGKVIRVSADAVQYYADKTRRPTEIQL